MTTLEIFIVAVAGTIVAIALLDTIDKLCGVKDKKDMKDKGDKK